MQMLNRDSTVANSSGSGCVITLWRAPSIEMIADLVRPLQARIAVTNGKHYRWRVSECVDERLSQRAPAPYLLAGRPLLLAGSAWTGVTAICLAAASRRFSTSR
jgi:hypothetical protein